MRRSALFTWAFMGLAITFVGRARADIVYLALGDSVTFGYDPSDPATGVPSFADQGFVKPFADFLATQQGGIRPQVLNLGIVGELSTSFFDATPPPGWTQRVPQLNLNYPDVSKSQRETMTASINAIHAAGDSVGDLSFLIGANDIFYLAGTPAFQGANPADQVAMVLATLGTVQANYLAVLDELALLAPEANLILPGYYNPFPSFAPQHDFYNLVLSYFNPLVEGNALAYGATYVDLYTPILGRELDLTNIASGDVHPNQAGYAVIASAIIRARAVPEPGSLALVGLGTIGLVGMGLRRRSGSRNGVRDGGAGTGTGTDYERNGVGGLPDAA